MIDTTVTVSTLTFEDMCFRITDLEAKNKRLNEQMDAIEEMGTESLNALPDCLMRLAPALVENGELKAKLQDQTYLIEQLFVMLDKTEETDDGRSFHPNQLRSCRATDAEKLGKILAQLKNMVEGKDT